MLKTIWRLLATTILLVLTGMMVAAAVYIPDLVFSFYPDLSRSILSAIASVTGRFPFSVFEVLVLLAILWLLYTFVSMIVKRRSLLYWLSGVALGVSIGLFLFVGLWGLNHFGPDLSESLGLTIEETSVAQLEEAAEYYLAKANEAAARLPVCEDGTTEISDFDILSEKAGDGYTLLGEEFPLFNASVSPVKPLVSWYLFSKMGITGIFTCFTGEANVNPDTYKVSLPATMCHELGHRMGCAGEDEANFCAFLACSYNSDPEFQYSGYYSAFIYCYNSLYKVSPDAARHLWASASEQIQTDIRAANAHYAQYEGSVQKAAQSVNDTYLKTFSEELGVQSYGAVTDYLIAWYFQCVNR